MALAGTAFTLHVGEAGPTARRSLFRAVSPQSWGPAVGYQMSSATVSLSLRCQHRRPLRGKFPVSKLRVILAGTKCAQILRFHDTDSKYVP